MSDTTSTTYPNKKASLIAISLLFILCLAAFSFGADQFSNSWFNQLSNTGNNVFVDYTDGTDPSNWYLETITVPNAWSKLQHIKACDFNGDNIKELITYNRLDTELTYFNAFGETLSDKSTIALPSGFGVEEVVCVSDTTGSGADNLLIILYSQSTNTTKAVEYAVVSETLAQVTEFFSEANDDARPIAPMGCYEYSQSGINYYDCAYPVDYDITGYNFKYISREGFDDNVSTTTYEFYVQSNYAEYDKYFAQKFRKYSGETNGGTLNATFSTEEFQRRIILDTNGIHYISTGNATSNNSLTRFQIDDCRGAIESGVCTIYSELLTTTSPYGAGFGVWYAVLDTNTNKQVGEPIKGYHGDLTDVRYCVVVDPKSGSFNIELKCYSTFTSYTLTNNAGFVQAQASNYDVNDNFWAYTGAYDFSGTDVEDYCGGKQYRERQGQRCIDIDPSAFIVTLVSNIGVNALLSEFMIGMMGQEYMYVDSSATEYTLQIGGASGLIYDLTSYSNLDTLKGENGVFFFEDISGDGYGELIFMQNETIIVVFTVEPSPAEITLYGAGVYNYYNPSCTNTNITFKMKECTGTLDCTYTTDSASPLEQEKICTSCGGTKTYACGSYDVSNPEILCDNFTVATTHDINFDMYTNKNNNTIAKSFTLNDLVISAAACDQGVDFVDTDTVGGVAGTENATQVAEEGDPAAATTFDEPDDLLTEFLTGTSVLWRIVIGLAIVIGLIVTVAQSVGRNANPSLYVVVGILGLIVVTAIGFLPAYILIIGLISMVLLVIVGKYIGSTGGS